MPGYTSIESAARPRPRQNPRIPSSAIPAAWCIDGHGLTGKRKVIQPQTPTVQRLDLGESEIGDIASDVGEERVAGRRRLCILTLGLVDLLVVPYDRVTVFGYAHCKAKRTQLEPPG